MNEQKKKIKYFFGFNTNHSINYAKLIFFSNQPLSGDGNLTNSINKFKRLIAFHVSRFQ